MNYAIILAGGVGSRFWPLSRKSQPKQFLDICSDRPLIIETIRRVTPLVARKNIYLAANVMHRKKIKRCLEGLGILPENIFWESQGKNTFAPIAILTNKIYSKDRDALIAVLPSDHFIKEAPKFIYALAKSFAIAKYGYIVTMGIKPARPETGYGYIKAHSRIRITGAGVCYQVEKFIEKPDTAKARALWRKSGYYWNSGMFIFKAEAMLQEIRRLAPATGRLIVGIDSEKELAEIWPKLPSISIDYAIMEGTARAVVLPVDYKWTDLGSWQNLAEVLPRDKRGNIFKGPYADINSRNTLIWAGRRLVAAVGLQDIIIVDTGDALLVCHKDKAQDVRKIVQSLQNNKLKKYL